VILMVQSAPGEQNREPLIGLPMGPPTIVNLDWVQQVQVPVDKG